MAGKSVGPVPSADAAFPADERPDRRSRPFPAAFFEDYCPWQPSHSERAYRRLSFSLKHSWTLGNLRRHLGAIPADRLLLLPLPETGTADAPQRLNGPANGCASSSTASSWRSWMRRSNRWSRWRRPSRCGGISRTIHWGRSLVSTACSRSIRSSYTVPTCRSSVGDRFPGRTLPAERAWVVVPDLAVEVLSPGRTPAEMERKVNDYLAAEDERGVDHRLRHADVGGACGWQRGPPVADRGRSHRRAQRRRECFPASS